MFLLELDKQLNSNILILMGKYVFHLKQQFGLEWNFVSEWWHGERLSVLICVNSATWPTEAILTSTLIAIFSYGIFPSIYLIFFWLYLSLYDLKTEFCIPVLSWLYLVDFTSKWAHSVVNLSPAGDKIICSLLFNFSSLPVLQPGGMGRKSK